MTIIEEILFQYKLRLPEVPRYLLISNEKLTELKREVTCDFKFEITDYKFYGLEICIRLKSDDIKVV